MGIRWHHKHKVSSLEGLIKEKMDVAPANENVENIVVKIVEPASEPAREKREIPQDVLSALEYCDSYHRGNTKCIRAYIEEIR
jgi:hypothetical protein